MAKKTLNRKILLEKLPPITYQNKDNGKTSSFEEKMNFERALLGLLQIDHEHEYDLCKAVAQHLLERVPEPDDTDIEE